MKKIYLLLVLSIAITMVDAQTTSTCSEPTATEYLEANQISALIRNDGILWFDGSSPGYQINAGATVEARHTLFAGGLWLGGLDNSGELRVAAMTYRQDGNDFWPGPIDDGTSSTDPATCGAFDDIYNVYQTTIDAFTSGQTLSTEQHDEIYNYPGRSNPHMGFTMPDQDIAPFTDVDSDGIYNPDNGDYPDILGDQCMFYIMNDIGNVHEETGGEPLGVEIAVRAFAFSDQLESTTFYEYSISNKSGQDYNNFLFGQWIDPDLGEYQDDFVGCDVNRNMGYVYNGDDFDEGSDGFGDEIPLQGIQIVCGPMTTNGAEYSLRSFISYGNNFSDYGNPETAQHYYNYLTSKWKNDTQITVGGNGQDPAGTATDFMYPANPSDPDGWSECTADNDPSDRRFIMSSGYYNFESGDKLRFLVAAHTAYNVSHPCPDIAPLQAMADEASSFCTDNDLTGNGPEVLEIIEAIPNIYPSPAKESIYFDSETTLNHITIYNAEGKAVLTSSPHSSSGAVDVSRLASGVYVLEYERAKGSIGCTKIIVE